MPVAIASGALRAEIVRVLDAAGLLAARPALVAAEETPAQQAGPDPYLRAIELLSRVAGARLSPRACVAIEDSRWGLVSARAAGLRTVAVCTTYDGAALASFADLVIPAIGDLDLTAIRHLVG